MTTRYGEIVCDGCGRVARVQQPDYWYEVREITVPSIMNSGAHLRHYCSKCWDERESTKERR